MTYFGYLIGVGLLFWAMVPLFKKDSIWVSVYLDTDELQDRKKQVYGNIADLEFDYAMGRLSDDDFNRVRQSFLSEAGRVIQKIESENSSELSARIIRDAQSIHKKKKSKQVKKCPHCQSKNQAEAVFCMECGKELSI